ncbi:MAG: DUF2817 domain-containing protein [Candidatus Magasanikbacteria bacterium]|nr:DUF2817 domain-containing protein [Candidatus Magasanikbacteria bacterium]
MLEVERLIALADNVGRVRLEQNIHYMGSDFPIYSFAFGSQNLSDPCLTIIGGVHGLERVGTNVVLAYMNTVIELLHWDSVFQNTLKNCRLLFYPLVNPVGMFLKKRANSNGVDLMRNAPVESPSSNFFMLPSGQRLSSKLPWYRGRKNSPMEQEAQALCNFMERETFKSTRCISIDVHSGYGMRDRLWFPYAKSTDVFPNITEVLALKKLLQKTYQHHIYKIEPQSQHYTTHGDIWDYLYEKRKSENSGLFLPFCLEMGSWLWIKKNPMQAFSSSGIFNPTVIHRLKRTLRRHILLFDFFIKAINSPQQWHCLESKDKEKIYNESIKKWYIKSA